MSHLQQTTNAIQEIFFQFLSQLHFDPEDIDYQFLPNHIQSLKTLSELGHSGVHIFDLHQQQVIFYSPNFGKSLGYHIEKIEGLSHQFFAEKIHPDDQRTCAANGVTALKMFNAFDNNERLNHKLITEYRMLNANGQYVRLIEQYQILASDKKGQIWLMLGIVDVSPNQDASETTKCQLLNFRTGHFIPLENSTKVELELSKREIEILKLVKAGLLSKEISNHLNISVHTVNTHRQNLLAKLGAGNSMEAIVFASKLGLLD